MSSEGVNVELLEGERLDELQNGSYRLIQHPDTFCFGTDSVLLADFAATRKRDKAVDLGAGNGAVSLLMLARQREMTIEAVEIQPRMAGMARRSMLLNGIEERIRVHCMDMRQAWHSLGREQYSLVVCNPPYGGQGRTLLSAGEHERIARHEDGLTPDEIARSAERLLKYGGRFCVVYPAARAFEMMHAMHACSLAPKHIRTVHSRADKPPKLILIDAVKGGGSALNWLPPLILQDENGRPSKEYCRIYGMDGETE